MPFILDIGANLVDEMYQGIYNGSKKHEPDLDKVLQRAYKNGLSKIIVTAGNEEEAEKAGKLVKQFDPCTAGGDANLYYNLLVL